MKAYIYILFILIYEGKFLIFFVCICSILPDLSKFVPRVWKGLAAGWFQKLCCSGHVLCRVLLFHSCACAKIPVLESAPWEFRQNKFSRSLQMWRLHVFFFQRLTFRFHKFEAWNPPSNTGDHRWGSASSATLHSFGIVSSVTFSTIYILFDSFELIHKGQESPSQMSNCPGYREKHNVVESNQFISELLHDMQIESRRRLDAGGVQGLEI